jgi:hypothetical protein
MISYRQSTWPFDLRDELIRAGCDEKVASVSAKAFGQLVDHVTEQRREIETAARSREFQQDMNSSSEKYAKHDLYARLAALGLIVLAVTLVAGVLIALFK